MGVEERLARFDEDAHELKDRAAAAAARCAARAGLRRQRRLEAVFCLSRARGAAPRGHCLTGVARGTDQGTPSPVRLGRKGCG